MSSIQSFGLSMHVIVLGAGVTGITTAWALLSAGYRVTVVEAGEDVALETSYANGGQISISHPEPWSSPSAPLIALQSLGRADAPFRFRFGLDTARYRWVVNFLRECLPGRHRRNAAAIAWLAVRSGAALRTLRADAALDYPHNRQGLLHLLRDKATLKHAPERIRMLAGWGINAQQLDLKQCLQLEPALKHSPSLLGAIYAPDDESGDAHLFTRALAQKLREAGGHILTHTQAQSFIMHKHRVTDLSVTGPDGHRRLTADLFVVCMGVQSAGFLSPLGMKLPIYPVKGYSVTLPVREPSRAPTLSLTDERRRLVCSRLGDRLRVAGTAEIAGFDKSVDHERCQQMRHWAQTMFPDAFDLQAGEDWAGLRPCMPSYVPKIGPTHIDGLWLNTGHGSLGWTLACGSAELLLDKIRAGKTSPRDAFSP